ncbi:MAG: alpha/beta hydrolase [Acidimicrobiia bacterium]
MKKLLAVLLFLFVLFHLAGGWYFSEELKKDALVADHTPATQDVVIAAISGSELTLQAVADTEPELDAPGVVGLDWQTGYGQLQPGITTAHDGSVVRQMQRLSGEAPTAGMLATIDGYAFPSDPAAAHGIDFTEIEYQSPLGPTKAWKVLAAGDTWILHVHGLGASRTEALRLLRPLAEEGYPQLVIDYRNDEGAPADPSGYYRFGETEWEDVATAVDLLVAEGAQQVVLVGYSTGASHIFSYLYRESDPVVTAVIVDSPNIDFEQTVDLGASQRSLPFIGLPIPGTLVWTAKQIASLRFGVDWESVDYLPEAEQLEVPVLVIHGTEDETVPLQSSQDLVAARPDLVRISIVPGAGHVRSWNVDAASYEAAVTGFLAEVSQ